MLPIRDVSEFNPNAEDCIEQSLILPPKIEPIVLYTKLVIHIYTPILSVKSTERAGRISNLDCINSS